MKKKYIVTIVVVVAGALVGFNLVGRAVEKRDEPTVLPEIKKVVVPEVKQDPYCLTHPCKG